jgi:uncharacterized membrane protein
LLKTPIVERFQSRAGTGILLAPLGPVVKTFCCGERESRVSTSNGAGESIVGGPEAPAPSVQPASLVSPTGPPGKFSTVLGRVLRPIFVWSRAHWALLCGIAGAIVYTGVLGWILAERYWAFQTFAWDLGGFNQGMWTTVYSHRLFYYTSDLPSGNTGSLLESHFSPFLLLLIPFYALAPTPSGLLVIQAAGLASGTIPLYFLCRRLGLPSVWTLLAQASYLASPVLMGIGWFDFHAEAFLPATVLLAVYCFYYSHRWAFVASWLLCLSVIETISPLLFLFALAGVLGLVAGRIRGARFSREVWFKTIFALVAVPAWLGIAELFTETLAHTSLGSFGTGYSSAYTTLGPNLSFIAVVPYALTHPAAALTALGTDGASKLAYILFLIGCLAFLPLLGPKRLLLPVAGWFVLVVLSNGGPMADLGTQGVAYGFSFLLAGFPFGLARIRTYWVSRNRPSSDHPSSSGHKPARSRVWRVAAPSATATGVILAVVVTSVMVSPLLPSPSWTYDGVAHGIPTVTSHDAALHQIIAMIPPGAGVLTASSLFPEVSSRVHAYVNPISTSYRANLTYVEALDGYVNESQYVLLDFSVGWFDSQFIVRYANLSAFGILAEEDQILLFERGWTGPPEVWLPFQQSWCGNQLGAANGSYSEASNVSNCGGALVTAKDPPVGTLVWYGPYLDGLPPGSYSVTLWVSVSAQNPGGQLLLYTLSYPLITNITEYGPSDAEHSYGFSIHSDRNGTILNSTLVANPGPGPRVITENVTLTFSWPYLATWGVAGWIYGTETHAKLYMVTLQQLNP